MMFFIITPILGKWVDIFILALLFSVANKIIQHLVINTKEYALSKIKSKKINKEVQQLFKEQKVEEAKKKQAESLKLMKSQFKYSFKPMIYVMIIAFPLLYVVKKYYGEVMYNFGIFEVGGLWAYIILGVVISIIVTNIYDKRIQNKYKSELEDKDKKKNKKNKKN